MLNIFSIEGLVAYFLMLKKFGVLGMHQPVCLYKDYAAHTVKTTLKFNLIGGRFMNTFQNNDIKLEIKLRDRTFDFQKLFEKVSIIT